MLVDEGIHVCVDGSLIILSHGLLIIVAVHDGVHDGHPLLGVEG